jgi:hypothetical protein
MHYGIVCHNSDCVFYYECSCLVKEGKLVYLDEDGKCQNFIEGTNEAYRYGEEGSDE